LTAGKRALRLPLRKQGGSWQKTAIGGVSNAPPRPSAVSRDAAAETNNRCGGDDRGRGHRGNDGERRQGDVKERQEQRRVQDMLRIAGLRPTRQRVALAEILYSRGNRHVSAELLHEEAEAANVPVSLATVYNTLHQFTEAGLLREVAVEGTKTYFDTNTDDHHHFFIEGENKVVDIPGSGVSMAKLPEAPEGMEIVRVDVVVRLRRKD
jgi:Fur family iron response transcriptional regulator